MVIVAPGMNRDGHRFAALLLLGAAALSAAQQRQQQPQQQQPSSGFNGTWVLRFQGQPICKLVLAFDKGSVTGSLTKPRELTIDQDGDVTGLGPDQVVLPLQKTAIKAGQLQLTIDGDSFVMTLEGQNRASLVTEGMRPWRLERARDDGVTVTLATRLPEPDYPPEIRDLRDHLRAMLARDQEARLAFNQTRMDAVDAGNRPEVLRIFNRHGWVTKSLAGKDAAHNFWLLVQHQTTDIQQRLLPSLEKAARDGDASMSDYAYLYDRVQMGLGRPQHWGTQAKCEKGKPVLYPVDDPAGLDARRKELFLLPVREYLQMEYLVKSCAQESTR